MHGLIAKTYEQEGDDANWLGLPNRDEEGSGDGRVSYFQHGRIDWRSGDSRGRIT
jgi:uncharacterized protein with LGFP repeats